MKLVNLTPHDIVVFTPGENFGIDIPRSGVVARVNQSRKVVGEVDSIPIVEVVYGKVEGLLDEPEPDTMYIVSMVVAQALKDDPKWRGRLLTPDTGSGVGDSRRERQNNRREIPHKMVM